MEIGGLAGFGGLTGVGTHGGPGGQFAGPPHPPTLPTRRRW